MRTEERGARGEQSYIGQVKPHQGAAFMQLCRSDISSQKRLRQLIFRKNAEPNAEPILQFPVSQSLRKLLEQEGRESNTQRSSVSGITL